MLVSHDQQPPWGGQGSFGFCFQVTVLWRKSWQELKQEAWYDVLVCSASFLIPSKPTCLGMTLPTAGLTLLHHFSEDSLELLIPLPLSPKSVFSPSLDRATTFYPVTQLLAWGGTSGSSLPMTPIFYCFCPSLSVN